MKRWGVLLLLAGCASEHSDLVIERQLGPLAQATDDGWRRGSAVLTGDPGTFTFPHSLSLRITIVDDVFKEMPTLQPISSANVEVVGTGQGTVAVAPVCDAMACTAEIAIAGAGETMLAVTADGPDGGERDCFYYAVVVDENASPTALKADLEARQDDCRSNAR